MEYKEKVKKEFEEKKEIMFKKNKIRIKHIKKTIDDLNEIKKRYILYYKDNKENKIKEYINDIDLKINEEKDLLNYCSNSFLK
jgi:hypothetical protein